MLNITGEITREVLCEKYLDFSAKYKKQDPQTFLLKEAAYRTLLQELIDKEQSSVVYNIILVSASLFTLISWILMLVSTNSSASQMILGLVGAYFLVDLSSGFAHVAFDHLLRFKTFLVGSIARDFNFHHIVPSDLTYIRLSQVFKPVAITLCPAFTTFGLCGYFLGSSFTVYLFFWTTCLSVLGQPIHRLAHKETSSNRVVAFLQKHRVILSPQEHQLHHQNGEQTHFCIFSGRCNPLLNRIFFLFLKRFTINDK